MEQKLSSVKILSSMSCGKEQPAWRVLRLAAICRQRLAEAHVGGTLCHLCALDTHGHANVSLIQRWGIVDLGSGHWRWKSHFAISKKH